MAKPKSYRFASNDRIWQEFPPDHVARRYLQTFYEVRQEVCGRDVEWPDRPRIEQEWQSELLDRPFSFSSFAYCFISYDPVLDEYFDPALMSAPSQGERRLIERYAMKQNLLDECEAAARHDENREILRFVGLVRNLLKLGIAAVAARLHTSEASLLKEWGVSSNAAAQQWIDERRPTRSQP